MNRIILAISIASIMMGCSTAYKTGQTIDDVYFSPARPGSEYVNLEKNDEYRASEVPMTDRYMRMKAFGGSRWNSFDDDYAYWNNPHWNNSSYFNVYPSYGYSGMNSLYFGRPSYGISSYLNPFSPNYYGQPVVVYNTGKSMVSNSTGPRTYSLSNYTPMKSSSADPKSGGGFLRSGGQPSNTSSNAPRGGYNPRSSGESYGSPSRTFSNSSNSSSSTSSSSSSSGSSSSSSSSSSSGSAPVRTFPKGGN